jgi:hypothetical protein
MKLTQEETGAACEEEHPGPAQPTIHDDLLMRGGTACSAARYGSVVLLGNISLATRSYPCVTGISA